MNRQNREKIDGQKIEEKRLGVQYWIYRQIDRIEKIQIDRRQKRRDQESSIEYIYIDKQNREKIDRQKIKEKRLRVQHQIYRQIDTIEKRQMDRIEKKRDRWKIEEKRLGVEYD